MAGRKYTFIFYGAVLIALAATYGVWRVIESTRAANQIATRPVVVANRDIHEGSLIDGALRVERWPEPIVPDSVYSEVALLDGRVARVPIFAGEAIVPGRLHPEGTLPGLEAKITPGKRAWSLRVDDVSSIAGMIQPDARVDVLLTLDAQLAGRTQRHAKLFMSNMRVLAMGTDIQPNERGEPIRTTVATLEVTPEEGEKLAVAESQGKIQLMLRSYSDPDSVRTKGATTSDVVAALRDYVPVAPVPRPSRPAPPPVVEPTPEPVAPPVVVEQKPETLTIPIYRGAKKSEEKFSLDSVRRDTIKP